MLDRPAEIRGRTAFHNRTHVLQLVAIKRLQAENLTLSEIQSRLTGLPPKHLAKIANLPAEHESLPNCKTGFGSLSTSVGNLPLKQLGYHARVVGLAVRTTVTQVNYNPFDECIEATYIFPLDGEQAVTACDLRSDDACIAASYLIEEASVDRDQIPRRMLAAIVSRLKILCHLDITDVSYPQRGELQITVGDRAYRLIVAIEKEITEMTITIEIPSSTSSAT
jgi:hypothetical protein